MAKFNPTPVSGGFSQTKINENFTDISAAIEKTLSRDGTSPNQMEAALDMNSNAILNASLLGLNGNLDLNGNKLVNLGNGTIGTDGVNLDQTVLIAQEQAASILNGTLTLSELTIPSIVTLKTLDLSIGQVVQTTGYYTAGDGGGAMYLIVAGATGTDDGGSYHDLSNGNQAQLIVGPSVNVLTFGARRDYVPGTPTSNDSRSQIQAANDFAASSSRSLTFPSGNYFIDVDSIVVNALSVTTDWNCYGASIYSSFGRVGSEIYLLVISGGSGIAVRGLTLDGQVTTLVSAGVTANQDLGTTTDLTADDYTKTFGMVIRGNSRDCKVIDCVVRNVLRSSFRIDGFGGGGDNWRNEFLNCRGTRNRGAFGDTFLVGDSRGTRITNCVAEDFTRIGFVAEGLVDLADQLIITGCIATNGHDAVTTENNAGFWYEGAQEVLTSNCIASSTGGGFLCNANTKTPEPDPPGTESTIVASFQYNNCQAYAVDTGFVAQAGSKIMNIQWNNCIAFVAGVPLGNFPAVPANFGFHAIRSGPVDLNIQINNCHVEIDNAGYASTSDYGGFGMQDSSGDTTSKMQVLIDKFTTYFVDPTALEADALSGNGKGSIAMVGSVFVDMKLSKLNDTNSLRNYGSYLSFTPVVNSNLVISDSQCVFVKSAGEFLTARVSNCDHLTTTTGNLRASNLSLESSSLLNLGIISSRAAIKGCVSNGRLNIQIPSHTTFTVVNLYDNYFTQDLGVAEAVNCTATNVGRTAYCYAFNNIFLSSNGFVNTNSFIGLNNGNFSFQGSGNVFDSRITTIADNTVSFFTDPLTMVPNFVFGEKRSLDT